MADETAEAMLETSRKHHREELYQDIIDDKNSIQYKLRACAAELVGVLLFVYIGSLSFIGGNRVNVTIPAFAHGFMIALLIIGLGHLSGGHFNPVVTLGIAIAREINPITAVMYVVSQLLGGFLGALLVRASLSFPAYLWINGGSTNMSFEFTTLGQAVLVEAVLTYVLVHTVLNAAVDSDGANVLAALGIGLAVLVDILAGGMVSGASMNPARSFGPAVVYSFFHTPNRTQPLDALCGIGNKGCPLHHQNVWANHFVHWVGPILGAVIAAALYKLVFAKPRKRWALKKKR